MAVAYYHADGWDRVFFVVMAFAFLILAVVPKNQDQI